MELKTLNELAERILKLKNVTILTHSRPDGDTIGSGYGLCYFLRSIGIKANVKNSDGFSAKFSYIYENYRDEDFEEECVVSVDVADAKLLGEPLSGYSDRIDLCIDHHHSNRQFARDAYVDGDCCATCLIIYRALKLAGGKITPLIADCLYTGIATDTGCFMYESTSPETHRAAAELIELGARAAVINRLMFQIKSKGRLFAEQRAVGSMEFAAGGKISLICITKDIIDECGIDSADLDGLAGIPLSVEGTEIGITLKQQPDGGFKVSVRTVTADASAICAKFGGGGHIRAAGCSLKGSREEVARAVIAAAEKEL